MTVTKTICWPCDQGKHADCRDADMQTFQQRCQCACRTKKDAK